MSIHIGAPDGAVAETVLLPGDPLRAQFVAENYLEDVTQYNAVRGMLGFTGTYQGVPVSVQGSGMGMPSLAIYATELITAYHAKRLIRIGSCGSIQESLHLRDIVLAMAASTDSAMNRMRFHGMDYAATAGWNLFRTAVDVLESKGLPFLAGNILSSDTFYNDDPDLWKVWQTHGVLAIEMETNQLYTLAARYGVEALTFLTVSDSLVTGEEMSSAARQSSFHDMVESALTVAHRLGAGPAGK
ncbi:MAG: purine-nucleoside phosphorylase [Spirochaeta sp.]|jgi:purine-nucleoside phosphorylase|nr:purine-nucleoside phosphorylase [Spirochaeta sp.]